MRVMGIDPGFATVGVGIIEKCENPTSPRLRGTSAKMRKCELRLIDFCTIETSPTLSAPERLSEIARDLGFLLKRHRPDLAVVEKLYFETNRKTAMQVAEARGVVLVTLAEAYVPVLEPTPLQLKLAVTGDGRADKKQVQKMLTQILQLTDSAFAGGKDDVTDAVALAVYGTLHAPRKMLDRGKKNVTIAS